MPLVFLENDVIHKCKEIYVYQLKIFTAINLQNFASCEANLFFCVIEKITMISTSDAISWKK